MSGPECPRQYTAQSSSVLQAEHRHQKVWTTSRLADIERNGEPRHVDPAPHFFGHISTLYRCSEPAQFDCTAPTKTTFCYTPRRGHKSMSDRENHSFLIPDLITEDGAAHELATSADMQPYLRLAMAVLRDDDPTQQLDEVASLPLRKRYIWRVASALTWAFADFDDVNVETDRATISQDDLEKVLNLLKLRPAQFCLFLQALVGAEQMERTMVEAIAVAKRQSG